MASRPTCRGGVVDPDFGRVGAQVGVVEGPGGERGCGRGAVVAPVRGAGPGLTGRGVLVVGGLLSVHVQ